MSNEASKVPASELRNVAWPACATHCAAIEYLGAGECESVCPFKFQCEVPIHPDDERTQV